VIIHGRGAVSVQRVRSRVAAIVGSLKRQTENAPRRQPLRVAAILPVAGCCFAKQINRGADALCQLRGGTGAVVVQEDDDWRNPVMWWWMATTFNPFARSTLSTAVTSASSIATSPATMASASVPANAAHVFRPIRELMAAPCSRRSMSGRPIVIL
jgi:hypothetical protein